MGLLSILGKGFRAMLNEALTPESFKAGEKFERYVRDKIFISKYYDLVEKTHSYETNKSDYVESSLKPDYKFRDRQTGQIFYVEAKFRSGSFGGKIIWCKDNQLRRYWSYHKEAPFFLILGLGDDPTDPDFIGLLPLPAAKYTGLFPSHVEKFGIKSDRPLSSRSLWNKM